LGRDVTFPLTGLSHTVTERFLRYVKIDTQSSPTSTTFPSTEKQKDLARLLVRELREIGIADAHLDDYGYVYATVPANTDKQVPVICFCAHMDTSPDVTGRDVKPQIVRNYQGGDIVLPADRSQVIRVADNPALRDQIGNDIITTDGTTLLGADNKAGVAEIMDAVSILVRNPQIRHGTLKILFTPDEEVGRGVEHVDIAKLGAAFGYTIDGETAGSLEDETFSADKATITVRGVSAHPGFAKGRMQSAIKIASRIVERLPQDTCSPETTEGREGFLHPTDLSATLDGATLGLIVRDFTEDGLRQKEALLQSIIDGVLRDFPGASCELRIDQQYRNMKVVLDQHPQVTAHALEAIRRAGLTPRRSSIRGGTDGSRLSFMGLPCPNIFAGEHAFHSRLEWVSVQDMQKAVETILHLAMIWEEQA
jgi:tripeptide aminopeptidase